MVTVVIKVHYFCLFQTKVCPYETPQQRKCINNANYNDKYSKNFVKYVVAQHIQYETAYY